MDPLGPFGFEYSNYRWTRPSVEISPGFTGVEDTGWGGLI